MDYTKRIKATNIDFELTCYACPEQYDVYIDGKQVAYVRLRWGCLRVTVPDVGGVLVYEHEYDDEWQGCFDSDEDREFHLDAIADILYNIHIAE
jgi:hypothetical protein